MDRIGAGALLAGRYRLETRLQDDPVASRWLAEDVTLERRAEVRLLAPSHPHVEATLDAARRAAVIDDPRLQRVLGVGVEVGRGYVVLEWIDGPTGADLAGQVSEAEACRIVGEVAQCLDAAGTRGLRHGRLTPGHVRRAADGRVRVSGLAVDAALIGRSVSPGHAEDTDVADAVALLYALISGRWPFGFVEGLLGAPQLGGRPVPLRELQADTSAPIEELCLRAFAGEPPQSPRLLVAALEAPAAVTSAADQAPVAAAHEVVPAHVDVTDADAAESQDVEAVEDVAEEDRSEQDVIGDDVPGDMEVTGVIEPDRTALPTSYQVTPDAPDQTQDLQVVAVPASEQVIDLTDTPDPSRPDDSGTDVLPAVTDPEPATVLPQPAPRARRVVTLPDAIDGHTRVPQWRRASEPMPAVVAGKARRSGMQWSADPDDGWALLPVMPQRPEDAAWGELRPAGGAATRDGGGPGSDGVDYSWLPDDERASRRRRGVIGAVVVLAFVLLVVVGAVVALDRAQLDTASTAGAPTVVVTVDAPVAEPTVVAPPPPAAAVPVIPAGVQPLDPPPGDNAERDADAPRAIDGDPATAWTTETYRSQDFGGIDKGVGLLVAMAPGTTVTSVTLQVPGDGGQFEIRVSDQPAFEGSRIVATGSTSSAGPVTLTWEPTVTSYLLVWFTTLPSSEGEWRGTIAEIQLA